MMKINTIIILLSLLSLSCNNTHNKNQEIDTPAITQKPNSIELETIAETPITEGCECRYSRVDSKDYIYFDDNKATQSFIKIDGNLIEFNNAKWNKSTANILTKEWTNKNYILTIKSEEIEQVGDESWKSKATIHIKSKTENNKSTIEVIGICGC